MSNFNKYSQYYDLFYKDKDYRSESRYVFNSLQSRSSRLESILELGCGSGNHAAYLTKNNIQIVGLERSETMVKEALAKKIKNFTPIIGDITNFELNQKFDAVVSLFHVISYLTDNESLISCFQSVHKHLNDNGLFLFDIWFTPAVYFQKPETRIKRLENESISVIRIAESTSVFVNNVVNVNFDVHITDKFTQKTETIQESHPMRHFSIPELELLAKLTGFEIIISEEFITGNIPSENTWGLCLILRKK
jgi:SAM-dependent methyltransferase